MDISSYPTIDAQSINLTQDLVFISNQENVAASSIAETLLEKRNISKKTSHFFKTVHLNVEPRQTKLNFLTSLNVANLLSSNSEFVCDVEFFVDLKQSFVSVGDGPLYDRKTVTLPSLTMQKQFGNKFLSIRSSEYSSSIDVGSSGNIAMSKIHYNNNDYNLRCLLSTTLDSIRFEYISYTRNQIFDTRINFTFESTQ